MATATDDFETNTSPAVVATGNLEITVSRAELLRELTAAQSVVERKTTIPILSNFLFEAADDRLTITATDLDQSLKTSCAAKVKKPGACTIPARKLYDYIRLLPEGEISIKLMDNHWVQIRAGRVEYEDGGGWRGRTFRRWRSFRWRVGRRFQCPA